MNTPININLKGKVAVVTGAGGVICSCLAKAIAANGAKVAVLDINEAAAVSVANEIIKQGGVAKAYMANVLDRASLECVRDKVESELGVCDILINGAGGNNPKATTDNEFCDLDKQIDKDFFALSDDGVRFVFELNFIGTFLPTQVFAKGMVGRKGCSILNISSMNAFTPLTKIPAYSAAKAGISNFTQWLAVHFAKIGIRVNAIAPGFFVTNQNRALLFDSDGKATPRTNKILSATPMGRFGEVEELIGATLFLLSDEAAGFVTGIVMPIDGGFSAYSGV